MQHPMNTSISFSWFLTLHQSNKAVLHYWVRCNIQWIQLHSPLGFSCCINLMSSMQHPMNTIIFFSWFLTLHQSNKTVLHYWVRCNIPWIQVYTSIGFSHCINLIRPYYIIEFDATSNEHKYILLLVSRTASI
jgi:hypothetical protein